MRIFYSAIFLLVSFQLQAQIYDDFYGAGHQLGITISSSSEDVDNRAQNSITGAIDELTMEEAARFLSQATLGASYDQVAQLRNQGYGPWIDEQMAMPIQQPFQERVSAIWSEVEPIQENEDPTHQILDFAFYEMTMKQNDLLRQRMAFAWSQILVVQTFRPQLNRVLGQANYYDILLRHAFGNFRDMLYDITLSVSMGEYLSSYRNQKFNPQTGAEPDENFAREIMQLFTIGPHELSINGEVVIDPTTGKPVETYDIDDVAELAKVFTGLSASKNNEGADNGTFYLGPFRADFTSPMKMFEDFHETGPKNFITASIPGGQTGMQDINDAIDYLFNHPNTGPFLATRLIQHLVKSNPSPAYIARVAKVFNNNGSGTRGDLDAVTRAILLDPEARECDYINSANNGKLLQPVERFISLFKAFRLNTPSGKFYMNDTAEYNREMLQGFNDAPSVFNFFEFDYAEEKNVATNDLVSPEFQIFNSVSSIAYFNKAENSVKRRPFNNRTAPGRIASANRDDDPDLDFSEEIAIYQDSGLNALLDRLNILLCKGSLTNELREIITNTVSSNIENLNNYSEEDVVHDCVYYIVTSSDYMIQL